MKTLAQIIQLPHIVLMVLNGCYLLRPPPIALSLPNTKGDGGYDWWSQKPTWHANFKCFFLDLIPRLPVIPAQVNGLFGRFLGSSHISSRLVFGSPGHMQKQLSRCLLGDVLVFLHDFTGGQKPVLPKFRHVVSMATQLTVPLVFSKNFLGPGVTVRIQPVANVCGLPHFAVLITGELREPP